jgi:DNA modification methylase
MNSKLIRFENRGAIFNGDSLSVLKELPDQYVNCIVTSPPYFGLRDYGTAKWEGGDLNCDHVADETKTKVFGNEEFNKDRPSREETKIAGYYEDICPKCGAKKIDYQVGLEKTVDEYVSKLVEIFRECRRVLKDDGTLWLNLGDSWNNKTTGGNGKTGGLDKSTLVGKNPPKGTTPIKKNFCNELKTKDLIGIPWRVAFALQADGWYLRQDIIWAKPNAMPESVTDRCTKSHEYIFLLSKSKKYYFDYKIIQEPVVNPGKPRKFRDAKENSAGTLRNDNGRLYIPKDMRNKRSVWTVNTKPYRGAHFAVFSDTLILPMILAGCPENGVVLDPFFGSGTTGLVAQKNGRKFIGIELNPKYIELAKDRLNEIEKK